MDGMKKRLWMLLIGAVLGMTAVGCSSKHEQPPPPTSQMPSMDELAALNDINVSLISRFIVFDQTLDLAAKQQANYNFQGPMAAESIRFLAGSGTSIRAAGAADLNGKIIILSQPSIPAAEMGFLAQDLKGATSQLRSGMRVLSPAHRNDAGAMLTTYMVPVKGPDQIVIGSVFIQFAADEVLRRIVLPEINGLTVNVWVMQTDGMIIYDSTAEEIGLNVLTQEPFIRYPTLVECAKVIIIQPAGTGRYTFLTKGSRQPQAKTAQWTTFSKGGRQWRLILNLEDRTAK